MSLDLKTIGTQVLSALTWLKSNYQLVILTIMLLLLPTVGWFMYQKGDRGGYDRAKLEDLAVKPDTAVRYIPVEVPASKPKFVVGKETPTTASERARIDSVARDSIEVLRGYLQPWTYSVDDTVDAVVNGRGVKVPINAYMEVSTIDHIARAIVGIMPFEIPMEEITRTLPVEVPPTEGEKMVYRAEGAGMLAVVGILVYLILHWVL